MTIDRGDFAVALVKIVTKRLEYCEPDPSDEEIEILNDEIEMYCMLADVDLKIELAGCPPKNSPPENVFDRLGLYMMEYGE